MSTRNWQLWGNRWLADKMFEFNSPNCAISKKTIKENIWRDWYKRMYDLRKMWFWIVEMFVWWEFYYYCMQFPQISQIWTKRIRSYFFTQRKIKERKMQNSLKKSYFIDYWIIFTTRELSLWGKIKVLFLKAWLKLWLIGKNKK